MSLIIYEKPMIELDMNLGLYTLLYWEYSWSISWSLATPLEGNYCIISTRNFYFQQRFNWVGHLLHALLHFDTEASEMLLL